jgi:hypothetical protein
VPVRQAADRIDNLSQDGMAELVAVLLRPGHQQLVSDHDPQRLEQVLVVQAGHADQEPMGHALASDRSHGKSLLGALGQHLDPAAEQVADRGRQLARTSLHRRQQLLSEEGVALRTSEHQVDQVGGRRRPEDTDQLGGRLDPVQVGQP